MRTASPIYVDERVLDEAGVEPDQIEGVEGGPSEEKLAVFRDFINSLDMDVDTDAGDTDRRDESR